MRPESAPDRPRLAIVLAGGSGRRLGVVDKPALLVDGRSLLRVALAAVAPARTVVVGPARVLPDGVRQTTEDPPGGGPAAALVAGLKMLADPTSDDDDLVIVLASDLPGISSGAVDSLTAALRAGHADGAVLLDPDLRPQYLAGVWRLPALLIAAASRPSWHGGRVSDLLGPLICATVPADRATTADVDTTADLLEWGVDPPESRPDRGDDSRQPPATGDDGVRHATGQQQSRNSNSRNR